MLKKKLRNGFAVMMTVLLCTAAVFPSMAASTISSISLKVTSGIEVGDTDSDVSVDTSSSKYSVTAVSVTNESGEWEDGDTPKLKVTVETEGSYTFASSFTKSKVSLSGSDATVSSVTRKTSSKLYVYITLDELEGGDTSGDYDLTVTELEWDDDGTATWDEVEDAKKYEVRLYRDDSSVTSVVTTTKERYDFGSYFTESGTYTFKVRAVYNSSNKGSWVLSDEWYVTSSQARKIRNASDSDSVVVSTSGGPGVTVTATWIQDSVGWWYRRADSSYPANQWEYINNQWYYFNVAGYMVTGWVQTNGIWYYCGSDGAMLSNTVTPDGYYVGADGAWIP
ncbi:MAG: hypothetical protein LUE86_11265 [Clostridiales bacterium]|nr:hypothetical protein [Clostridiales bacterium]